MDSRTFNCPHCNFLIGVPVGHSHFRPLCPNCQGIASPDDSSAPGKDSPPDFVSHSLRLPTKVRLSRLGVFGIIGSAIAMIAGICIGLFGIHYASRNAYRGATTTNEETTTKQARPDHPVRIAHKPSIPPEKEWVRYDEDDGYHSEYTLYFPRKPIESTAPLEIAGLKWTSRQAKCIYDGAVFVFEQTNSHSLSQIKSSDLMQLVADQAGGNLGDSRQIHHLGLEAVQSEILGTYGVVGYVAVFEYENIYTVMAVFGISDSSAFDTFVGGFRPSDRYIAVNYREARGD